MTPKRKQKIILISVISIAIGIATALILNAFRQNIVFFFSPSQVVAGESPIETNFRLGGLVEENSVKRLKDGLTVTFRVTDNAESIPVVYSGLLPDLFREGQGIVALGKMDQKGIFHAEEVLAKHDENYMPPEVADSLKNKKTKPYHMDTIKVPRQ